MNKWISSWGFLPINFLGKPFWVENETQRVYIRNNVAGSHVRLLFSNLSGQMPMTFAHIVLSNAKEGSWETDAHAEVTFHGRPGVTLQPGQECYSDPIAFSTRPNSWLAISTYMQEKQCVNCCCTTNNLTYTFVQDSVGGDYCGESVLARCGTLHDPKVPGDLRDMKMVGLRQVDVLTGDDVKTVVCFGDSITHIGHWSGWLAKRLYEAYPGRVSLINRGIGGNRLLGGICDLQNENNLYGAAGQERFVSDVFEHEKLASYWTDAGHTPAPQDNPVDLVILLEGINDVNHWNDEGAAGEEPVTSGRMIGALQNCIAAAHAHGSRILLATMTPEYDFNGLWREATDGMRQAVNHYIRFQTDADGMLDFERSVRDEANPIALAIPYDVGDHLHPSFEGGKKIAEDIPLEQIRRLLQG